MQYFQSVGVIGYLGMVGGTTYRYFKDKGQKVYGYDLAKHSEKAKKLAYNAELVFVCVPTPFVWKKNHCDLSIVEAALKPLPEGAVVVLKSTIPIGMTEKLQKKFPGIKLLFNPEFLSEATCDADFRHPDRQIIGYTEKSYPEAIKVLHSLPLSAYDVILPSREAELLKYMNNLHGMVEVMESNHYWEVCEKEGLDYDRVTKAAIAAKWVGAPMGRHYRTIFHKGYRGFGGKCFPKDLNSWLEYCERKGINGTLMGAVRKMNRRILKEQKLTEADSEKK